MQESINVFNLKNKSLFDRGLYENNENITHSEIPFLSSANEPVVY